MTREQRAEELMAKGPIWLVRRVVELEDELDRHYIAAGNALADAATWTRWCRLRDELREQLAAVGWLREAAS